MSQKSKEFYEGVKAFDVWVDDLAFSGRNERVNDAIARLNPYNGNPLTERFVDWSDGFESANELEDIENHVDPSQLSLEEMQDFAENDDERNEAYREHENPYNDR